MQRLALLLMVPIGLVGCGGEATSGMADLSMNRTNGTTGGSSSGTTGGSSTGTTGGSNSGTTGGSSSGTTGGSNSGTTGGSNSGTTGGADLGNSDMASTGGTTSSGGTTGMLGCGSGGVSPSAGPDDLFPCSNPWYKDESAATPTALSSTMIGAITQWQKSNDQMLIDFSMVILHADSSTPTHTFTLDPGYDPDNDHDAVPVPAGGAVEGNPDYHCADGGDCHLLVIDSSAHKLYELWQADIVGNSYTATQESVWDLTKAYTAAFRGYGCTSADAGGLSITTGLIGVREVVKDGVIKHALRFTMPNAYILGNDSYVYPATHGTSGSGASSTTGPAYGAHLRLKNSAAVMTKINQVTSKGGKVIIAALQQYGMILADGSNYDTLIAEDDRLTKLEDPTLTWTGVLSASDLSAFAPGDFEIVDYGSVRSGDDCVRAP